MSVISNSYVTSSLYHLVTYDFSNPRILDTWYCDDEISFIELRNNFAVKSSTEELSLVKLVQVSSRLNFLNIRATIRYKSSHEGWKREKNVI